MKRFAQWLGGLVVLLFLLQGTSRAFEKVGTTSFQFLKIMTDARSTGMGEAFSAVVNSSQAVFWNPGALVRVQHADFAVSYLDWLLDVKHTSVALAYRWRGVGVFGFQGLLTDVGEIEVTRVDHLGFVGDIYNPGLTGEKISPSAMSLGLSFARSLTDKFSFGVTAKMVREDLVVQSKTMLVFDMGLIYNTGYRTLQLSAVVRHFGPEVRYVDKSYPLPQTFSLGVMAYVLGPGNALLFPSGDHSLLLAYDMTHPRDYNQQHHLGFEYSFRNMLFVRGGYKFNYDEEGPAFGFGVKVKNFRFDYSYSDFGPYFSAVHRFTFGIRLD